MFSGFNHSTGLLASLLTGYLWSGFMDSSRIVNLSVQERQKNDKPLNAAGFAGSLGNIESLAHL